MMMQAFVAYPSGNLGQSELIRRAAEAASTMERKILTWRDGDASGSPIAASVERWIQQADSFIADVSSVNDNVTYELGFAIGLGKPTRLIRSEHIDFRTVKDIALLDTLGHDPYTFEASLVKVLKLRDQNGRWPDVSKNRDQPVFILNPPQPMDWSLRIVSGVKKIARLKFRSFNPWEISRLNATEAYEQTVSSYGIIVFWLNGADDAAVRNNQRASFVFGLARGRNIPALLIAKDDMRLPLDLEDQATRWAQFSDLEKIVRVFRDDVADLQNDFIEKRDVGGPLISQVDCGDPIAENEASGLSEYFLRTDAYQRTLNGEANLLVGRKGSGKTAVLLQVRDRTRADRENIVIDLLPEGYQLVKLKEFILDQLARGARKEVIAAFWEYVLWLEIAYKLLEKDRQTAARDALLLKQYQELEQLFLARVDTGSGDFSERLKLLTASVIQRFKSTTDGTRHLDSSKVLEIVYGEDVHRLRDAVSSYLHIKGFVFFLLDNLDRFWTPGGFNDDDALIIIGLIESMQEITRKLARKRIELRWAIFVRSDVYEFLIRGMADYGKLSVQSLEWADPNLLKALFQKRITSGIVRQKMDWDDAWGQISVQTVKGKPVIDFLIEHSMMRPRYLIRLFETARRRAITVGQPMVREEDYLAALGELGWQVMEDLDREVSDLVPSGDKLLFEIVRASADLTASRFRYLVGRTLIDPPAIEKLLDIMLWGGAVGVVDGSAAKYIYDCGYKRQYLAALIRGNESVRLELHPTLMAALH